MNCFLRHNFLLLQLFLDGLTQWIQLTRIHSDLISYILFYIKRTIRPGIRLTWLVMKTKYLLPDLGKNLVLILVILLFTFYLSTLVLKFLPVISIFFNSLFYFYLFLTLFPAAFGRGGGFPFFSTKPHFRKSSFNLLNSFSMEIPFPFSNRYERCFCIQNNIQYTSHTSGLEKNYPQTPIKVCLRKRIITMLL